MVARYDNRQTPHLCEEKIAFFEKDESMKTTHRLTACLLMSSVALLANAQSRLPAGESNYIEFGLVPVHVKSETGDVSHPQAARLTIGGELHPNWAVEGFYLTAYSKDTRPGFDATATHYGATLKPKVAMTENTEFFARFGWAHSNITVSDAGSRTGSDFIYGLGFQTYFTKSVYGQLDYMNYYDKDGISSKAYSLSVGTRF